jgi:hypothetical protein
MFLIENFIVVYIFVLTFGLVLNLAVGLYSLFSLESFLLCYINLNSPNGDLLGLEGYGAYIGSSDYIYLDMVMPQPYILASEGGMGSNSGNFHSTSDYVHTGLPGSGKGSGSIIPAFAAQQTSEEQNLSLRLIHQLKQEQTNFNGHHPYMPNPPSLTEAQLADLKYNMHLKDIPNHMYTYNQPIPGLKGISGDIQSYRAIHPRAFEPIMGNTKIINLIHYIERNMPMR